jgi:transcriptional regulator with XRE-family HTH domain
MINHKQEFKDIRRNIGQNIYDVRKSKRMTLRRLSNLSNISIQLLDQFELGKNQISTQSLMSIAKSLEVSMYDFLEHNS